ncbi:hypothetical protein G8O24_32035 [Bradyrhizobium sp. INPA01-394B]|uniref:Uncharacterized protein n=1 Tax=Bradyrhizobium campsiandrae TaxID=1729892 RepID=A0ABR7TYP6_9BRAD|nr:hypothetical protein [Bradyrhizobium campsiandrae]MBC9881961.1 hypothetical protein [Bradyrhizobium campsiandrae]MBC9976743.1 hypothetical protein [Bradyrhizobium campsiandrae]
MREASSLLRRAGSRVLAVVLLAAATALAGCAGGNVPANSYAMAAASAGSGATVAFESIDGPPPQVFDRMVGVLDSESKLRSLSIVSREGAAAYRVRSYLSAQVVRGKTVIAWVWDVYDANQQRALRLSGEEPTATRGGKDPWAAADDLVLRKIAQAGFSGLSNMINGTPDTPGTVPGLRGPAVASVTPEAPAAEMPATALGYAPQ